MKTARIFSILLISSISTIAFAQNLELQLGASLGGPEFVDHESTFYPVMKSTVASYQNGRVEVRCQEGWDAKKKLYAQELVIFEPNPKIRTGFKEVAAYKFASVDQCFNFRDSCKRPSQRPDVITLDKKSHTKIQNFTCGEPIQSSVTPAAKQTVN